MLDVEKNIQGIREINNKQTSNHFITHSFSGSYARALLELRQDIIHTLLIMTILT